MTSIRTTAPMPTKVIGRSRSVRSRALPAFMSRRLPKLSLRAEMMVGRVLTG